MYSSKVFARCLVAVAVFGFVPSAVLADNTPGTPGQGGMVKGAPLSGDERSELMRLREENKRLKDENARLKQQMEQMRNRRGGGQGGGQRPGGGQQGGGTQ